jgi:hypothetical protein
MLSKAIVKRIEGSKEKKGYTLRLQLVIGSASESEDAGQGSPI